MEASVCLYKGCTLHPWVLLCSLMGPTVELSSCSPQAQLFPKGAPSSQPNAFGDRCPEPGLPMAPQQRLLPAWPHQRLLCLLFGNPEKIVKRAKCCFFQSPGSTQTSRRKRCVLNSYLGMHSFGLLPCQASLN